MKKIMFNDKYGLTAAVLEGRKTMTRRVITGCKSDTLPYGGIDGTKHFVVSTNDGVFKSTYKVGEIVALAQKYLDLRNCDAFYEALDKADPSFPLECIKGEKGCYNKMFVKAEWMPHRIRITDIKVERLQDISDEDVRREGVWLDEELTRLSKKNGYGEMWRYSEKCCYASARGAFAALIDKVSGKGTWENNPWVFAYTFELID
ncbi:MAG: hypothetical protein K6G25_06350 [Bacteroidales bacterium]|nr:hypothetical protein [Bacteroidales bacterium]